MNKRTTAWACRRTGVSAAAAAAFLLMSSGMLVASAQDGPAPGPALALPTHEMCSVPQSLLPQGASLRHARSSWFKGEPLVIVAVGSGSTAGAGAGGEDAAYPHYLRESLMAKFPGREIRIINQGHSGETAAEMLARFPREVIAEKPSLVIWQTGTVEAVRSLDVDSFAGTLNAGVATLGGAKADVILVNPQYAARIELLINYEPYLSTMDMIANQTDATLFDRFHIMHHWFAKGVLDLSSGNRDLRRKKAEEAQACIGMLLAEVVERSLR